MKQLTCTLVSGLVIWRKNISCIVIEVLEEKKKNYGIEKYNMGKRMISEKLKLIEQGPIKKDQG